MDSFIHTFIRRIFDFYVRVLKFILLVLRSLSIYSLVFISILGTIIILSIGAIIIDDTITFTADEEKFTGQVGTGGFIDPNDPNYFYLVAQALDKDKINKDYESSPQMKNFFEEYSIGTGTYMNPNTKEYPGKDIDIYEMCSEIIQRPEINGASFDSDVLMETVLGNWSCESGRRMGTGKRLYDSELYFYVNGAGFCDPLGQAASIYTTPMYISDGYSAGMSFISKGENPSIPDEQRAIFNSGYPNISAGDISSRVFYPTELAYSRRSDGLKTATASDAAIKHLLGCKLNGGGGIRNRGSLTWLPDAMYTAYYANRIMNEGHDRDTHYTTDAIRKNNESIKKLCEDAGLDRKQTSAVLGCFASSNRYFKWEAQTVEGNTPENNTGCVPSGYHGLLIYTYIVMIGEGSLDKIAETHKTKDITAPIQLINEMYGDPSLGGGAQIFSTSEYAKLKKAGSYTHKYNANTLKCFNYFGEYYAYSEGQSPFGQRAENINYPGLSYIYGTMTKRDLETMIQAYYDYQDASGNHPYRLYEVAPAGSAVDGVAQSGKGPFGLEYYNADGTVNEANMTVAVAIFADIVTAENCYKDNITVKGSYTIDFKGKPYTVKLRDGKDFTIPNFWGYSHNSSVPENNWGQCTWWARGRAQLWLWENWSQKKEDWYLDSRYNWHGDGSNVAGNVKSNGFFTVLSESEAMSKPQDSSVGCITGGGQTHIFFTEAYDAKNQIFFESHGNMGNAQFNHLMTYSGNSVYTTAYYDIHSAAPSAGSGSGFSFILVEPKSSLGRWTNYGNGMICLDKRRGG